MSVQNHASVQNHVSVHMTLSHFGSLLMSCFSHRNGAVVWPNTKNATIVNMPYICDYGMHVLL